MEVSALYGRMKQRWWDIVLLVRIYIPPRRHNMYTEETLVKTIAVLVDCALSFFKSSCAFSGKLLD